MPALIKIAVDALGSDSDSREWALGALTCVQQTDDLHITVIGDAALEPMLRHARLAFINNTLAVDPTDRPAQVLRRKLDSSMACALKCVARGDSAACVTGGNTGALVALGCKLLPTLPGLARPAICRAMPTRGQPCLLLDLGANTQASPEQLMQFAQMGAALARVRGVSKPRLGLLNMGGEPGKGRALEALAAPLIAALDDIDYGGFAEGHHIFSGDFDVVVCDGFTGNALLKASEGAASLMLRQLRAECSRGWSAKLSALLLRPVLSRLKAQLDPERLNGAVLLGLSGAVVKSHGGASQRGIVAALMAARELAAADVCARLGATFATPQPLE